MCVRGSARPDEYSFNLAAQQEGQPSTRVTEIAMEAHNSHASLVMCVCSAAALFETMALLAAPWH